MVNNPLWSTSNNNTIFLKYIDFLKKNNLHKYINYKKLHKWSINNKKLFWKSIWDFTNIVGDLKEPFIENEDDFIKSKFFNNSKINYSKNIVIR